MQFEIYLFEEINTTGRINSLLAEIQLTLKILSVILMDENYFKPIKSFANV